MTETEARKAARLQFDQERIQKIVDGMPPFTSEQLSRLARILVHGAEVTEARRAIRESPVMDHIRQVAAEAPSFTPEQRSRVGAILSSPAFYTEAEVRARADLAEACASEYIKNLVDGKQLTPEGIARLRVLLTPEA